MHPPARLALAALFAAAPGAASAVTATCVTTPEGTYTCGFEQFGGDGSFTITSPGRPSDTLSMTSAEVAEAVLTFDRHGIGLPGPYLRVDDDPACWDSQTADARPCVT